MINKVEMMGDIERVLYSEEQLHTRIKEVGAQISKDYAGEELVVIGLLKGAAYFLTELTEHITVPVRIDFIKASSYGSGTKSSGKVDIDYDTSRNIAGKNVLLVDDVVDSRWTRTVCGYRLMEAGCEEVYPFALADSSQKEM